jgi:Zn-dependent peptidase ImmA (M78 family)
MIKFVPYLSEEQIERDAAALLTEYSQARGVTLVPPIPIEDIVEKHLKLGIEFDDTHRLFGVPRKPGRDADILGAMLFDEARIVIDESLDPEENPAKEGRYRFTLAHEGGGHWRLHRHLWRLHRHLFARDSAQATLLQVTPSVVCRSSQARERMEWQADFYASCVLMPRKRVFAAWDEAFPGRRRHVMDRSNREAIVNIADAEERELELKIEDWQNEQAMEHFAHPFAQRFLVSRQAMRIRWRSSDCCCANRQSKGFFLGDLQLFFSRRVWSVN